MFWSNIQMCRWQIMSQLFQYKFSTQKISIFGRSAFRTRTNKYAMINRKPVIFFVDFIIKFQTDSER